MEHKCSNNSQPEMGACNRTHMHGTDKPCMMIRSDNVKLMGAVGRNKHGPTSGDCRDSITILRTGSAAGRCGPTIFLVKGKQVRTYFLLNTIRTLTVNQNVMCWQPC